MKFLIVEPDELWQRSMERRMRRAPIELVYARSEDQVRFQLQHEDIDCVIAVEPCAELHTERIFGWMLEHYPGCVRFLTVSNMTPHIDRLLGCHIHGVIPHPCTHQDILQAYSHVQEVRKTCPERCFEVLLCKLDHIPRLSESAVMCERALSRGESLISISEKIVKRDPGLVTDILRMANAMVFGQSKRIEQVSRALSVLGENTFKNLLIAKSLPIKDALFWEQWQMHAVRESRALVELARLEGLSKDVEDAICTLGLLHDLGEPIMNMAFGSLYNLESIKAQKPADPDTNTAQIVWERKHFGLDHGDVGAYFFELWGLPDHVTFATKFHTHAQEYQAEVLPIDLALLYFVDACYCGQLVNFDVLIRYGYSEARLQRWHETLARVNESFGEFV
ncbi:MAG: HDOD domain-containing protein [Zetaproteobacteria bacterium]|nr:HDOD domain-containing protein [Zetaproteobacteria bacterium]